MFPGVPRSQPCRQRATIGVMSTVLLVLVVVLVVAGLVYGGVSLLRGDDPGLGAGDVVGGLVSGVVSLLPADAPGLAPVDPDGVARPLPNNRSLSESDLKTVRFDV